MHTDGESFVREAVEPGVSPVEPLSPITTTLYDLIAAIRACVEPDEEDLVVATVVHILQSGRVRFLQTSEAPVRASW